MAAKLQLALDDITRHPAIALIEELVDDVDIVEVGTPLMMRYGMSIVTELAQRFPNLDILCDAKIMDAAGYEARLCFDAGAKYVTFLAVTDDLSIEAGVEAARGYDAKIMADMICVPDMITRARRLEGLGVDVIAVHTGVDQQARGRTPLDDLETLRGAMEHTALAVAGGIDLASLPAYLAFNPQIVIVGSGIAGAADPVAAARALKNVLEGVSV